MIPTFTIPTPPPEPTDRSYPSWRNWVVGYANIIYTYIFSYVTEWVRQFNLFFVGYGPDLASATTITVHHAVHRVTGTTPIQTITQPVGQTAVGVLTLMSKDGFSLISGGNISLPSTLQVPANTAIMLAYHPALKLWSTPPGTSKQTFSAIYNLKTSTDSPFAVPSGAIFASVTLDTGSFTANLSATPTIGDTVTFKLLTNPGGLSQLTIHPAGGMTIEGSASDYAQTIVLSARSLVYAAANTWDIYAF